MSPETQHNLRNVLVLFGAFNGFALAISSEAYTAWSIRVRNGMYYALLRREVNRIRRDDAEEIAERVCRIVRPVALVAANGLAAYAVASAWK